MYILLFIAFVIEVYYWFFYLPKHWKEIPDARNAVYAYKVIIKGEYNAEY